MFLTCFLSVHGCTPKRQAISLVGQLRLIKSATCSSRSVKGLAITEFEKSWEADAVIEGRGYLGRAGKLTSHGVLDGGDHVAQRGIHRHITVHASGFAQASTSLAVSRTPTATIRIPAQTFVAPGRSPNRRAAVINQSDVGSCCGRRVLSLLHADSTQYLDRRALAQQRSQTLPDAAAHCSRCIPECATLLSFESVWVTTELSP